MHTFFFYFLHGTCLRAPVRTYRWFSPLWDQYSPILYIDKEQTVFYVSLKKQWKGKKKNTIILSLKQKFAIDLKIKELHFICVALTHTKKTIQCLFVMHDYT